MRGLVGGRGSTSLTCACVRLCILGAPREPPDHSGVTCPAGIHACHGALPGRSCRTHTHPRATAITYNCGAQGPAPVRVGDDERAPRLRQDALPRGVAVAVEVAPQLDEGVAAKVSEARREVAELAERQRRAGALSREAVAALKATGMASRDAAAILGVSPQRVSQLAKGVPAAWRE